MGWDGKKTVAHPLTLNLAMTMHPSCLTAVRAGDMDGLRALLDQDQTRFYGITVKGNNILHIAASLGNDWPITKACNNPEFYDLLLHQNLKGDTILHCAAREGHAHIISLMLDHQVGMRMVGMLNQRGDSALHEAARGGHANIVQQLLAVGENMASMVNGDGESPLYLAAVRGSVEIVDMLLGCAIVDYRGPGGQTALHAAVCGSYGPYNYFSNLFIGDHAIKQVMKFEKILFAWVPTFRIPPVLPVVDAYRRSYDIVNMLLEKMSGLNLQADASQSTPIHYAASLGDVKMVCLLLQANNTVAHLLDDQGLSAIHIAASKDYTKVIKKILHHYPDATELTDGDGNNFFHVAAKNGATAVVKLVLSNPLLRHSINETDNEGNTPLHLAVMSRNIEIVQLLLSDSRVNKNIINCKGLTPLDVASSIDVSKFSFNRWVIIKSLKLVGAKFGLYRRDIVMSKDQGFPKEELDRLRAVEEEPDKYRAMANNLAIVAALIATVTFAAAFTLPGGYNNDDSNQGQGMAILARKVAFKVFLISDTIAMTSSMLVVLLLIRSISPEHDARLAIISMAAFFVQVALGGMLVAFSMGIYVVVVSQCRWLANLICGMAICLPYIVFWSSGFIELHFLFRSRRK